MKRIEMRMVFIVGMILSTIGLANAAKSFYSEENSTANYSLYNAKFENEVVLEIEAVSPAITKLPGSFALGLNPTPDAADKFSDNKLGIRMYGSAVIIEKYKVDELKKQLKEDRANRDQKAIVKTKRKLEKAKLNLLRDQLHFIVDKEALRQDYLLEIKDRKRVLAEDRKDLDKARWKTVKQWITYDDKNLKLTKIYIRDKKKEIKADKMTIASERALLKAEMESADKLVK